MNSKLLISAVVVAAATIGGMKVAKADDCLEAGWRDKAGNWSYYHAWVDAEDGNRFEVRYDFHHGKLELKVHDKEKGDGTDVKVFKGRWYEGRDAQRSGKIRLELKAGHHRAKGWYTFGDDEGAPHMDFVLRDCQKKY